MPLPRRPVPTASVRCTLSRVMTSQNTRGLKGLLARRRHGRAKALDELGSGFAALYEGTLLAIATLTPDGRFLQANAALQRYLGYTEGELAVRTFNDVTYPADIPECTALFDKVQRREIDHFEMEKRYVRKTG